MTYDREKAILLAENLLGFVQFVDLNYHNNRTYASDPDKLYRLKNLVDEYNFQTLAKEILRINRFSWVENETEVLVNRVRKGIDSVDEYIKNNLEGLFLFSPRVYTIKCLNDSFTTI